MCGRAYGCGVAAARSTGSVPWGRRQVKLARGATQSYGGITTVHDYHLIPRQEDVVDSTFMHDNYASPSATAVRRHPAPCHLTTPRPMFPH